MAELVEGAADVCRAAGCAILGGETAELPGIYREDELDFCGTVVGLVERDELIDGSRAAPGDVVVGLASNGIHANGFSLVRALVGDEPFDAELLLPPTRCYLDDVRALRARADVRALAHVTGGGIAGNLARVLPEGVGAVVDPKPGSARRSSPGSPTRASRRTSCGGSSTSGSATAWSCGRPISPMRIA